MKEALHRGIVPAVALAAHRRRYPSLLRSEGDSLIKLGEVVMIMDLHLQGVSVSAIARACGVDRETIRKYIERGLEAPVYSPRAPRGTVIDPFADYLRERVKSYLGLTGQRLLRELNSLGYQGG